jgi:phosphonate dehydrogenase
MKPTVVITHWVHPEVIDFLSASCNVVPNLSRDTLPADELLARAKQAQAIMVFMPDSLDEAFLERCPELRIVAAALKGYDNFDVESCTRRGVWFTIVPDLLTVPTAELAIGLLMGLTRKMLDGDELVRSGAFPGWRPTLYGTGLYGGNAGIIGMGRLGRAIAERLKSFGVALAYADPVPLSWETESELRLKRLPLDELLGWSDFVILAAPLTAETFHLVDDRSLQLMEPHGFLVNVGRGSTVDEEAVANALELGKIAGYAADTFQMEDWALPDRPREIPRRLLQMRDRTLFTPHLGSAVDTVRCQIALEAARNIVDVFEGRRPAGAVNDPISLRG